MKILKVKEIDFANNSEFIDLIGDLEGNSVAEEVVVQVMSNITLAVSGTTIDGKANANVAVIKLADLKSAENITAAGIYIIPAEALSSITLTATGSSKVLVKVLG